MAFELNVFSFFFFFSALQNTGFAPKIIFSLELMFFSVFSPFQRCCENAAKAALRCTLKIERVEPCFGSSVWDAFSGNFYCVETPR
jgi:hypothetical protein